MDDLHSFISFDDPHEWRTWVFDLTFLLSDWTCIYGRGCPGVLTGPAAELEQGCCSYGAHFIDGEDRKATLRAASRLTAEQWEHRQPRQRDIVERDEDGNWVTTLVDDACVFLNRPGFPGGAGCALHRGAVEAGERPLDWKPDVCWQLPLRLVDQTDDHGHVTSTLREWKRRDWGAGGAEFDWWCTDSSDAFCGSEPVLTALRDEIVELVGQPVYDLLVEHLERPGSEIARGVAPHPAAVEPQGGR